MKKSSPILGFSLIEILIAMAILALLTSIAWPAYTAHIAKAKRADAKAQLASAQQWMEVFYSENYSYAQDSAGQAVSRAFALQPFSQSPKVGEGSASYTLSVTSTASEFLLTATPISGGWMADDACGSFSLDHTGQRSVSGLGERLRCWN